MLAGGRSLPFSRVSSRSHPPPSPPPTPPLVPVAGLIWLATTRGTLAIIDVQSGRLVRTLEPVLGTDERLLSPAISALVYVPPPSQPPPPVQPPPSPPPPPLVFRPGPMADSTLAAQPAPAAIAAARKKAAEEDEAEKRRAAADAAVTAECGHVWAASPYYGIRIYAAQVGQTVRSGNGRPNDIVVLFVLVAALVECQPPHLHAPPFTVVWPADGLSGPCAGLLLLLLLPCGGVACAWPV